MKPTIKTFANNDAVATAFAQDFVHLLLSLATEQDTVTVALSGGSTPKLLFEHLADNFSDSVDWSKIHFFWGDERCVDPADAESNYGEAHRLFLSRIEIPPANIHRVFGESEPAQERIRYASEIKTHVASSQDGRPSFDIIMLGMGSDGHTASIFPHQHEFLESDEICEVATHPESGQQRITLTGPVINAAKHVFFLITGSAKSEVLAEIVNRTGAHASYPASHINPPSGATFYIDDSAAASMSAQQ